MTFLGLENHETQLSENNELYKHTVNNIFALVSFASLTVNPLYCVLALHKSNLTVRILN